RYMPQAGGRWKATNNDIVERHPDGTSRLRFQPVASHLTPMAMADLTGRYATALDLHLADPLVLVPLAMLDFLCIYPFPDGNGRMSRLLTLLLLYHFDYAVGRYISLERIFEDTKESYYETLEASSQGWHQGQHDAKPWLDYFWGALLRAYREFEERVGTIERGRGSKGDRVRAEVLGRCLPFSLSEIEEACPGVSRDMVRLVLRAMKSEGLIESTGKGRGAKWKRVTAGTSDRAAVLAIDRKVDKGGVCMGPVFKLRGALIERAGSFSRSFDRVAGRDIQAVVDHRYAQGRYWPEPLVQINPTYQRKG